MKIALLGDDFKARYNNLVDMQATETINRERTTAQHQTGSELSVAGKKLNNFTQLGVLIAKK